MIGISIGIFIGSGGSSTTEDEEMPKLLAGNVTVNLNEGTAAKQPLFTVPAGRRCCVTHVVHSPAANNSTTYSLSAGFNAGGNDWNPADGVGYIDTAGKFVIASIRGTSATSGTVGEPGEVFGLVVTTPEGAALTARVDIFGYEISVATGEVL